ncbi:MAG: tRNA (adenosine(37)-N6)-threonylcarbamoyltransferase complex dimerization subunit type 1 TsaB [Chitinophagaceae bacterium]|nr:tRNA (adenosine(37)-N6)-threonylcarbamoyltransferase complex dimerization subunit type 1 TsaB [Chitinophagaceae bacterium]
MSLLLNIDTASEKAHVSFAENGELIGYLVNESQKDHAGFLQAAIAELVKTTGVLLTDIDAVAVTAGPGSYTGLRVGMASAKGLCYTLGKPLVTPGTLDALTASALQVFQHPGPSGLYCPMIDARRMEVFTAMLKPDLTFVQEPLALILDERSFEKELNQNNILFFGNGSGKWERICKHENALFRQVILLPEALSKLAFGMFSEQKITELAYSEPFYLKEFQLFTPK